MNLTLYFLLTTTQFHLPPGLLESICYVESNHRTNVVHYNDGYGHSYGLCQIKLIAAQQVGFKGTTKQLMNPKTNIYYSGRFLHYQLKRYHSVNKAVIAYNKGNAKGLTTSQYQVKVYKKWKEIQHESQRSISSTY